MEENNGLRDILLDKNEEEKSGKVRKVLMSVATLVILFLVVLIIVKYLNSGNEEKNMEAANVLALPEEPSNALNQSAGNASEIFEQVPIATTSSAKSNFEDIVSDYKNARADANETKAILPKSDVESELMPKVATPRSTEVKIESANTTATGTANTKKDVKKVSNSKSAISKKSTEVNSASKANVAKKDKNSGATAIGGNYIQVASVSKFDANSAFVKKIIKAGYNYRTYEAIVADRKVTKILVGPFDDVELADNIIKVRRDINSNAFVFRLK